MSSRQARILLDEHVWAGLTRELTERGYDVIHATDTPQVGSDDEVLLAFAAAEGRVLLTFNVRDFAPLVAAWYEAGREHAGVILSTQLPPGELLRRIERLLVAYSVDDLWNTVRWLGSFGAD